MGCLASADLPKFCLTYQNIYEKPSFPVRSTVLHRSQAYA